MPSLQIYYRREGQEMVFIYSSPCYGTIEPGGMKIAMFMWRLTRLWLILKFDELELYLFFYYLHFIGQVFDSGQKIKRPAKKPRNTISTFDDWYSFT